MRPRRVLMTADTIGGVWQYSLDLCRSLSSAGIEVTLATLGREPSARQQCEAERIPALTLHTSTFALEWMPDADDDIRASARWLLALEDAVRPDIVHLNGFCHGSLPWSAPVMMVAHSCVLSWWESVKGTRAPREWDRYSSMARQGLVAADCVAAPSRWMAETTERLYGVRGVLTISNGRDRSAGFSTGSDKQSIILGAGRLWDPAKNFAALDRGCADVAWPLYLAGPAHGPFDELFVSQNGVMLGTLASSELAAWMRQAEIYALPAKYEPFGLSALEAGLCGCALVLGDIPSLRETWEDAAVFVDPDDHRALASAISQLIAAPEQRAELGRRAAERSRHFPTQRMATGYLAAYAQLLRRRGHKSRVAASA